MTRKETSRLEKQRLISSTLVVEFCSSSWCLEDTLMKMLIGFENDLVLART